MDGVHWAAVGSLWLSDYICYLTLRYRTWACFDGLLSAWVDFNSMWLQLFTVDHGPAAHGELHILH
jgi:hypothetical protein